VRTFDKEVGQRNLQTVRFVNFDKPTTSTFTAEFKSLNDSATVTEDDIKQQADEDQGDGLQLISGIQNQQKSSPIDEDLQSADDHRLAANLSIGHRTDHNVTKQSDFFPTSCDRFVGTGRHELAPKSDDRCAVVTSGGIDVQIYCGNLVNEEVDAIVNPANSQLIHNGGAALAIAEAAGIELLEQCREYIAQHGELKVTQAMHTSAGSLCPPVIYIIHAAGPSAAQFPRHNELYRAVFDTFRHCMLYANNFLHVSSVAIPAISSGELTNVLE